MTAPESPTTHRHRVPFWDNARFACIVLVVFGHAIQRLTYDSDLALALYFLVYAFHMPALAIISGYFSRADPPGARRMSRVITDIVLPYLIFEGLWTITQWIVEGRGNPNPTKPSWTLWFLLALAIFRLVLPYLALLRWPLTIAVVCSVAAGYLPNLDDTFSLARTLGLLPFFTLGWWLHRHDVVSRLRLLRPPAWWVRAIAAAVLAGAFAAAWGGLEVWNAIDLRHWLFYDDHYGAMVPGAWWGGAMRLATMLVAVVLTVAFCALLPMGRTRWTRFGAATMYVYLLHSFALYPLRESGVLRGLEPSWAWLLAVGAASVVLAVALSSRPVRRVFRPLVEPRPRWLFRDPTLVHRAIGRTDPTGARRATS